jgi:hypothetical protein
MSTAAGECMRRRGLLAALGIVPLVGALLSGCVAPVCNEAAAWPPGVWLDPTPWLAAHPGSTLTACLDGNCKKTDPDTKSLIQLFVSASTHSPSSNDATYTLTISSSTPIYITRSVTLSESSVSSSCGTQTWWQVDARLGSSGRLSVWHSTVGPSPVAVQPNATPAS